MSQPTPGERPAIAAAVIIADGKVLMARRRVKEGKLSWQFPAGEMEAEESDEQAAMRETEEETTLVVTASKHLGTHVHPNTGRTMNYVACEVISGTAQVGTRRTWRRWRGATAPPLPPTSPTRSSARCRST